MNNMMRKNNNRGGNKHRGGGGQRRYNNGGGGGNRGQNDAQNLQRQKHHATQQLGKYNDLARNAQINGDRVDVEYYLQHVDHYTRILTDIAAIEAERQAQHRESQIIPGGPNDPNAQPQAQDGNADAGSNETPGNEGTQAAEVSAQVGGEQQQRQRHHRRPQQQDGNGAREANANKEDIPLPGSILPPI